MAKYHYDKSALKDLGTGPFLKQVQLREQKIAEAPEEQPVSVFNANRLAAALHPDVQYARVSSVAGHIDAGTYTLVPDAEAGTHSLAYFRAGQYVSVSLAVGDAVISRPYTICSAPRQALGTADTRYQLTVRRSKNGYASDYILNHWDIGTKVTLSGPLGEFYYTHLRDASHVVAVAGGSGITPFYSMAAAIADGTEDFDLTILYGSRRKDDILLKDELEQLAAGSGGKVKIVHVLSDEPAEGYEAGFITADLIAKYAPDGDYSVFVCGPKALYSFMERELPRLALPRRRIRMEVPGEYGDPTEDAAYPAGAANQTYNVTVVIRGEAQTVPCRSEQSLLRAMEQAGIHAPSHCRSGVCGWCRSLLKCGRVYIPEAADGRRLADVRFGWIHPCCTYPVSDVTIEPAI